MTQYVAVKFSVDAKRSYTYRNDGPPVSVGDDVKIAGRKDADGWQRAFVEEIIILPPKFATKPIMGLAPPTSSKPSPEPSLGPRGPQKTLFD